MEMSNEQFQQFLEAIMATKRRTFASCNFHYDGKQDTDTVEVFLAATTAYKNVERISDFDALQGLPLLLQDEAAIWWQGVKHYVLQWDDFCNRLRNTFAPKKPAYMVYHQITHEVQECNVTTDAFIARKRALFATLPPPALTESQQIDMIFALIRFDIRKRMPRDSVPTFEKLLEAARGIEQTLQECELGSTGGSETNAAQTRKEKPRCTFCRNRGHTIKMCRRKKKVEEAVPSNQRKEAAESETQASPIEPKFSCYGCGAPGVVRSSCPKCKISIPSINKAGLSFW